MSAQPSAVNMAVIERDRQDAEWLAAQLQYFYGFKAGQLRVAGNLITLLRQRWVIDLLPAAQQGAKADG